MRRPAQKPERAQLSRAQRQELAARAQYVTGRAFAEEFPAPGESVVDMCEAGYDTEEIADEFDVSSYVIEDQIRNQNRIRWVCYGLN